MATARTTIDERLVDVLDRLEHQLARLAERERPRGGQPELLTKRAAARILGCDRQTTLEGLIRAGRLRTVPAPSGKGLRIPRAEVDRVLRVGVAAPAAAAPPPETRPPAPARARKGSRARARAVTAAELADQIRAIPVPGLDEE